jgi:phage antirepressor YoqD-like protein
MTKEQRDLAETIAKANGGCVTFNITKAAKIAGRSRNNFPAWLHERGVMVEKSGKDKYVNVNDLAGAIIFNRESPIR